MKLPGLKSRVSSGLPGFAGLPTLRSGRHSSPGLKAWGFLAGFITGQLEVDLTHSRPFVRHSCASRACPALDAGNPCFLDTGSLFSQGQAWIPVFTGMTNLMLYCSDAHGRPHSNPVRDMSRRIGRPFRKFSFASRRGVFTIPKGDTDQRYLRFRWIQTLKTVMLNPVLNLIQYRFSISQNRDL